MKISKLALLPGILGSAILGAANMEWAPAPADNNWNNSANWIPSATPENDSTLVFGENSSATSPALDGISSNIGAIHFSANTTAYDIQLRNGAQLTLTGNGIINETPGANPFVEGQVFRVKDGSTLTFTNNAGANSTRIANYEGSIIFAGNSSAGSAYMHTEGPTHGGPLLQIIFTGNANAGNANIINYGGNALLRFEKNSHSGNASITNRGNASRLLFTDKAELEEGTKIVNSGQNAETLFNGNSTLAGSSELRNLILTANSDSAIRGQILNNSTITNNGVRATLILGGNATSTDIALTNNGASSVLSITDAFRAEGALAILNISNSAKTCIAGNETGVLMNSDKLYFYNSGQNATFHIGGNVTINARNGGNIFNAGSGSTRPVTFIIGGDSVINSTGSSPLYIRTNSTHTGRFFINGTATVKNAYIVMRGSGESDIFTIGECATFTTNRQTLLDTTAANGLLHLTDNATFETSNTFAINRTATFLMDGSKSKFSSTSYIYLNGTSSRLIVGGNSTFNAYALTPNSTGTDGVLALFKDNANATITGINATAAESLIHITDNATFLLKENYRNVNNAYLAGSGPALLIDGNATFIGTGTNYMNSVSNGTSVTIAGNATVKDFDFRIWNNSSNKIHHAILIADTPTLENVKLDIGGRSANGDTAKVTLALAENHTINLKTLTLNGTGPALAMPDTNIHFTGGNNQTLSYDTLTINASTQNLTITQDGEGRANYIHNATATLVLNRENTLKGELTAQRGTITLNHTDAASTATLNISSTATVDYGSAITDNITLGGLSGNGTLSATLSEIRIGNNNYDSEFGGTLSGNGDIVKIGDGTLSLTNINTAAYAGQVAVQSGALRINGTLSLAKSLALDAGTQLILSANAGQTALNADTLTLAEGAAILVAPAAGFAETAIADFIKLGDITGSTNLDETQLLSTANARQTFTLNLNANADGYDLNANAPLPFASTQFAQTPNQAAVGTMLDQLEKTAPANPLLAQLAPLSTAAEITAALNELNPASLTAMGALAHRQAAADLRIITQRTDRLRQAAAPTASTNPDIRLLNVGASLDDARDGAAASTSASSLQPPAFSSYFSLRHNRGTQDGNAETPGYDSKSTGITIGIDRPTQNQNALYGFQFAYEKSEADFDHSRGEVELESLRLIGYLAWIDPDGLWMQAHASFNFHDYETTRKLPTLGGQNKGETDAHGFTASLEIGKTYDFRSGTDGAAASNRKSSIVNRKWTHAPYVRLTFDTLNIDQFTEAGIAETTIEKQTPQSLVSRLAWRLQHQKTTAAQTRLFATLELGWEHEYLDRQQDLDFRLTGTSAATVRGYRNSRDSLIAGLNLSAMTSKSLYLTLAYDLDYNADFTDHRLTFSLGKKF